MVKNWPLYIIKKQSESIKRPLVPQQHLTGHWKLQFSISKADELPIPGLIDNATSRFPHRVLMILEYCPSHCLYSLCMAFNMGLCRKNKQSRSIMWENTFYIPKRPQYI
ncbi:hypothetical protein XENTR_v10012659 [Xenopus tropicalis]|nr:hypothetical protein XENTR_v10012659 [Xenopus tropicalis]